MHKITFVISSHLFTPLYEFEWCSHYQSVYYQIKSDDIPYIPSHMHLIIIYIIYIDRQRRASAKYLNTLNTPMLIWDDYKWFLQCMNVQSNLIKSGHPWVKRSALISDVSGFWSVLISRLFHIMLLKLPIMLFSKANICWSLVSHQPPT